MRKNSVTAPSSNRSDLDAIRDQLRAFAHERDWDRHHSPKNLAMALVAEAAEVVEHFQWLTESEAAGLPERKRDEVASELADVLLYLVRLADKLGVDLAQAAARKMAENERRYPSDPGARQRTEG